MIKLATKSIWIAFLILSSLGMNHGSLHAQPLVLANARVQDKMVKIYGAGGLRGLEAYQSGFLVSDEGHVVTAWSYVLDSDELTAVLADGRRYRAELVGSDPRLEIALLKLPVAGLPYFDLAQSSALEVGDRVLAFSNLYGIASGNEAASMLQGVVSAIVPLAARRGVYQTPYDGPAYIVDATTNNAGAAGGALTDAQGRIAGILGKELRSSQTNLWLNYAIPISELRVSVTDILAGKVKRLARASAKKPADPATLESLGIVLLPQVIAKTPAFIDRVLPDSPAAQQGLLPDDLVVMIAGVPVQSGHELIRELSLIDRLDPVRITVLRGQRLIETEMVIPHNGPMNDRVIIDREIESSNVGGPSPGKL